MLPLNRTTTKSRILLSEYNIVLLKHEIIFHATSNPKFCQSVHLSMHFMLKLAWKWTSRDLYMNFVSPLSLAENVMSPDLWTNSVYLIYLENKLSHILYTNFYCMCIDRSSLDLHTICLRKEECSSFINMLNYFQLSNSFVYLQVTMRF